jgi:hypothetical protein
MMMSGPDLFAIRGERGMDLFLRISDEGQARARFRCIATIDPDTGRLEDFDPQARRDPAQLRALAKDVVTDTVLSTRFSLADPAGWPRAAQSPGDPVQLFLYHEFFRAWQVADMAAHRLLTRIEGDPAALPLDPGKVAQAVVPLFDFNRLALGRRAARLMQPVLATRIAMPGWREPKGSSTGYALRMLGDLCLRAGAPDEALRCFETGVSAGDNAHRRRKAIEAAHAAGNIAARDAHIAAYCDKWTLPADLAALQAPVAPDPEGRTP